MIEKGYFTIPSFIHLLCVALVYHELVFALSIIPVFVLNVGACWLIDYYKKTDDRLSKIRDEFKYWEYRHNIKDLKKKYMKRCEDMGITYYYHDTIEAYWKGVLGWE